MEKLAQFCASLRYRDLSERCRERAKMLIADSVTNMVTGFALPIGPLLRSYILEFGGAPESTFLGGKKVPSALAVFGHSAIASATQCDDTHNRSVTHISSAVVPTALALCEQEGLGGEALIESVVVGAEAMARVGMTLNPKELYRKGVHPSSLCGPFGTAAASGKALGFTTDQFLQAFGLAAVQASGLLCGSEKGPLSWYIQYGRGAENGVVASRLVRLGASAPDNIFHDPRGFFKLFSNDPKPFFLRRNLGRIFAIEQVSQKRYPCFQFGQPAIEAFFKIQKEQSFNPEDVRWIVVHIPSSASQEIFLGAKFELPPRKILSAQTDLRFLLGLAAAKGEVTLRRLIKERSSRSVIRMARKVSVEGDEDLNKKFPGTWPARVEVYIERKMKLSQTVFYPKGDWRNPMSWDDLYYKFVQSTGDQISPATSKKIWTQLSHLEELKNIRNLLPRMINV